METPKAETPPGASGAKEDPPAGSALEPAVMYSRRLYDDILGWYRSADAKAQVVIGLDGAFLAFITAAAFRKPDELASLFDTFLPLTWLLLGLMASILASSGTAKASPYPVATLLLFAGAATSYGLAARSAG